MGKKKDLRKSNDLETGIGDEAAASAAMNDAGHEGKKVKGGKGKKRSNKLDMLKQTIEDDESDDKASEDREEPLPQKGKDKSRQRGKKGKKENVDDSSGKKNNDDNDDVDDEVSERVATMRFDHSSESETEKNQLEEQEKGIGNSFLFKIPHNIQKSVDKQHSVSKTMKQLI